MTSPAPSIFCPSMSTMTSPARRPAFADGPPGVTSLTSAGVRRQAGAQLRALRGIELGEIADQHAQVRVTNAALR